MTRQLTPPPGLKMTPMFEQYFAVKAEYPDALLFFRMGDFYELFFEDAEVAARALQIALTSRNPGADYPVPMCGVPHHSAQAYIQQLLEKGHKVAICDQVEDPRQAKGLVKRAVTGVRTPGTAVEDSALSAKGHNYLGAFYWDKGSGAGGFAWLDYSTGAWTGLYSRRQQDLWQWVQKMKPRELLLPDLPPEEFSVPSSISLGESFPVRLPVRGYFDLKPAGERIKRAQNIQELDAVGLNKKDELVRACGALLAYLAQTQKHDLAHLSPFKPLNLGRHLIIDEITERNLEIFRRLDGKKGPGTLWQILDETLTPMGGRLLEERLRHPWREIGPIGETQDAVEHLLEAEAKRKLLREALNAVYDLERLSTRIYLNRSVPKDFVALRESLKALDSVRQSMCSPAPAQGNYATAGDEMAEDMPPAMRKLFRKWDDLSDVIEALETAFVDSPPPLITEGGLFKQGFHPELDELIDLTEHGEQRIKALLAEEQAKPNLSKLKLGFNRVFGYYFELSKTLSAHVPDYFDRRQTVANAERFITPALKDLEDKMLSAQDRRKQLEYSLFQDMRKFVSDKRERILFMADLLAGLDYWQSLAEAARKRDWKRPSFTDAQDITIREGRHPVIESMIGQAGFIANDLHLDETRRLIIITGPNMAGKSTILRQVAIIAIMAQMGSFVPAAEARLGLADRVFSRVGASDNLAQGQSTFMVEMMETARILRQATVRSLVILDEIGRGTSTFDGLALAWAVVEDLVQRPGGSIRTLFATHYHELTALEGRLPGVHNMNIAIREWGGEIIFMHRLVPGPSDRSYGIEVAKLAGVPQPVVQRAKQVLAALEKARGPVEKSDASRALHQLLPGIGEEMAAKRPSREILPPRSTPPEHPLFVALRDIDTDNLTPIKALALLCEWKQLWGEENS